MIPVLDARPGLAGQPRGKIARSSANRLLPTPRMFAPGGVRSTWVALGVSAQTALRWHRAWVVGDRETLVGAGRAGRMR